ncbi:hypothetical protein [Pontibacter sp. G13]|uniref:hypothetical protein n=1 Tax=Pontibacter sp. G13 TaxID=3074898 RepID=UPI00288B814B|nr:hypothetical protein [Pontibacter sp. G13]WNJ19141.1 hypothetical protein RJD25_01505 [Pontibacter sp. G13]
MILTLLIAFLSTFIASLLTIGTGLLMVNHRSLIQYGKSMFSFIRQDFDPDLKAQIPGPLEDGIWLLTEGGAAMQNPPQDMGESNLMIHRIIVIIGKLTVLSGFLLLISGLWSMLQAFYLMID